MMTDDNTKMTFDAAQDEATEIPERENSIFTSSGH